MLLLTEVVGKKKKRRYISGTASHLISQTQRSEGGNLWAQRAASARGVNAQAGLELLRLVRGRNAGNEQERDAAPVPSCARQSSHPETVRGCVGA